MINTLLTAKWPVSLGLFLLALLPRLPDLGRFLTADEFLWVDRSRNFLAGLTNSAYHCTTVVEKWEFAEGLACTLRTGHPGVTTMWTGSFGFILRWLWDGRPGSLHDYVVAVATNPLDPTFVAPERLGTVLLTSLWVVAVYWLVRRLFGPQIALVGASLIALDPFHIALSRVIHHDALSTTFMTLSVLGMLIYWGQQASRSWLLLSGVMAGFGFLSKSPALYLLPFVALVGLWFAVQEIKSKLSEARKDPTSSPSAWRPHFASLPPTSYFLLPTSRFASILTHTLVDGLLWFAVAAAVFVIFWPAMWVVPLETLETVFFIGSKYATGGHAKGNYFLGQISQDPGPLFYPVTWLYRTSPLVVVGVVGLSITLLWRKCRQTATLSPRIVSFLRYLPLILLFIGGYYLLLTIGEKKQDRYFLPVYPWLNLISAAGLVVLADVYTKSSFIRSKRIARFASPSWAQRAGDLSIPFEQKNILVLILVILLVNGLLVRATYPYYFTYYNPLLGGIKGAEKAVTIGWGEGLDLAAAYLNHKANGHPLRVASWYQSTFAPYYHGEALSYSKEKGKVLAGDYAVFYINQTQRRFPDDVLFDYFDTHFKPEQTISLEGLDYAWIYPSLGVDHYLQDQTYTGIAALLAWQWRAGDKPLHPGQAAEFELYWEYLGKKPEESFFFRLVDTQGRAWAEGESRLVVADNPPVERWREGEIIFERGSLTPPLDMPPGQYQLQIGFYTQAAAVSVGELLFTVPQEEALITIAPAETPQAYPLPETATALNQPFVAPLTLLGATWPQEPRTPGDTFALDLYWRVEQPLSADTHLHIGLMDERNEPQQAWFNLSLAETFNAEQTTWPPGTLLHTRWSLAVLAEVPPGSYHLELVWPDNIEETVAFGSLLVK